MDAPSNGGRDSRFNLNSYDMPILSGESASEIYNSNILHNRPTSITSGLSRSSVSLNNSCASTGLPRGIKRTSSEMCYDQNMQNRSMMNVNDCGSDIMEDSYSPSSHQKNSPLSNGKKTKGRVKIKMEYIDNKLRRYTTFSKRKTGIMKKAYELSTLTGTQVMLLVASETGHVYTFATRKLQPMITSESGKNLIQMCLNSPDPCPSGSGDQRMSATGFEETELSYNVGDDEKVDSSSCSPYRSDSSDSSEVESASGSPPSSPPPLISLQDIQSTSSTPATKIENGIRCIPLNSFLQAKKMTTSTSSASGPPSVHFVDVNAMENAADKSATSASTSSVQAATTMTTTATDSASAAASSADILNKTSTSNGLIFTLEQLQREFGIHMTAGTAMPQYITIPLLTGISNNANPPAAHQTPADLSNRSRK